MGVGSIPAKGGRRTFARRQAERVFRDLTASAAFIQTVTTLPAALQRELDAKAVRDQRIGFRIAVAPTQAARQRLWLNVPQAWRDEVGQAAALNMAGVYGVVKPWAAAVARIRLEVPVDLVEAVTAQARRVFDLGGYTQLRRG